MAGIERHKCLSCFCIFLYIRPDGHDDGLQAFCPECNELVASDILAARSLDDFNDEEFLAEINRFAKDDNT